MARRSVPPPKPRSPILTAGQKQRRIERLQKCITSLEAFDSQKVRKRFGNPEVVTLEAAIDKALSPTFGYGTLFPCFLRQQRELHHGSFADTETALTASVSRSSAAARSRRSTVNISIEGA